MRVDHGGGLVITKYRISFEFADGSSIDAPIDAGNELVHGFYQLAKRIEGK